MSALTECAENGLPRVPPSLLHDTARLGSHTFVCRYDRMSGTVYTYEPLGFVMGDALDLPDRRLLIESIERSGGVTRIRTRAIPPVAGVEGRQP